LIHEGQMEGATEKLPVQMTKFSSPLEPDEELKRAYVDLLKLTRDPVFDDGEMIPFDARAYGVVSFVRREPGQVVAYIGQVADAWREFNLVVMDLTEVSEKLGLGTEVEVKNLLNGASHVVSETAGRLTFQPAQAGVESSSTFCLLELIGGAVTR